jgi:hypothetical protein
MNIRTELMVLQLWGYLRTIKDVGGISMDGDNQK